jgi:hypothetical protein
VPLLTSREARKRFRLSELLKRELGLNGFPFAIVLVFGGSAWLEWAWKHFDEKNLKASDTRRDTSTSTKHRTIISTLVASLWAITQIQKHSKPIGDIAEIPLMLPVDSPSSSTSASLDLTIIFCVRALDALFQHAIAVHSASDDGAMTPSEEKKKSTRLREHLVGGSGVYGLYGISLYHRMSYCSPSRHRGTSTCGAETAIHDQLVESCGATFTNHFGKVPALASYRCLIRFMKPPKELCQVD